jgi:hypothetical protein
VLKALVNLPDWVTEGATVRMPGGPWWRIARILRAGPTTEVHLNAQGDDQPVVWGLDRFLLVWEPVHLTRFERDEPI